MIPFCHLADCLIAGQCACCASRELAPSTGWRENPPGNQQPAGRIPTHTPLSEKVKMNKLEKLTLTRNKEKIKLTWGKIIEHKIRKDFLNEC